MQHIWTKVEELRDQYATLQVERTPIDVFTFFEIDLGLNPIPFDDLYSKYRVEAAITADFMGIYLDAEQYILMEKGPDWKLNRLRFTVAHELAHYFLHRDLPKTEDFSSLANFGQWATSYGGEKYKIEQEANEFAGRLLVPEKRLRAYFDSFAAKIESDLPNFIRSGQIRYNFSEKIASKFGVNPQVIEVRLDRESIWTAA